jgi:hypothetical protein
MKTFASSRTAARALALTTLALLSVGLGACGGNAQSTAAGDVRNNITPELSTLTSRPVDLKNDRALVANYNWRIMSQDFNRAMFLDRPSRLTHLPMPH